MKMNKTYNNIHIYFITKKTKKIIYDCYFSPNTTFKEIFSHFSKKFKSKGYILYQQYKFDYKLIKSYEQISNFYQKKIFIEVKESYINNQRDEIKYNILLFPKLNPFELYEYNVNLNKINFIKYTDNTLNFFSLYKFSKESAFCNSEKELFMSGGVYNGRNLNLFWIVEKKNLQIFRKIMPIYKKYHSMLYIPDNFIIITGGDTLSTFIYDIQNNQFIKWASLNEKHFQPGLVLYNDYIYAFDSLNDKKKEKIFFERTDLTSKNPSWEKIFPIFDSIGIAQYEIPNFFGVSNDGENILFLGGENNEKFRKNFSYNPIINKIFISETKNFDISFWDKTFYNISDKYKIGIPTNFQKDYTLCVLNKDNENISKIICSPQYNQNYCEIFIQEEENEEDCGDIFIENDSNNYAYDFDYSDDNNLIEEEIIISEDLNQKNEDTYNKNYNNKLERKKKEHLFISNYILDEQLINRETSNNNIIFNKDNELGSKYLKKNKGINKKNYLYNPNKNKIDNFNIYIEQSQDEKINNNNDNNKNLIPKEHNKKYYIYIPESILEDNIYQRELFDNNNEIKDIILINYTNEGYNNDNNKSNGKYKNNYSLNKKNKLYVSPSLYDSQIVNRNIFLINKNDDINGDIILVNEFINDDNNKEKEDNFEKNKYKVKNNKHFKIYVPDNLIEEQIINREVIE